jgi:Pyruvate/2-oxoacid:ferredoxin oxidoreductase delta subunit
VSELNSGHEWLGKTIKERGEKLKAKTIEPSVVIPVNQSFSVSQKVMPEQQVRGILQSAEIIAQTDCGCRTRIKNCDAPTDTCVVLNATAKRHMKDSRWRRITIDKAIETLDETAEYGLVHLALYSARHQPEAICSCCSCCCHDLRAMLDFGNLEMVLESDYTASFDKEKCTNCGACIKRCHFKAWVKEGGQIVFLPARCYGCGLCVMSCPAEAIMLVKREDAPHLQSKKELKNGRTT